MSYMRDDVKAITDKVLNMAKADAVEVQFSGGERSATRYANSTITANLVEHDQQVAVTVYYGQKSATTTAHQFDDASLKNAIEQAQELAKRRPDNPELMPLVKPPQEYTPVEAALPSAVDFGPAERARMVKQSVDVCEKKGVLGAGYIPKLHWTDAYANSEGLFGYYRYAEASFILTCRTPDQTGSGWAGTTGLKDVSKIDAAAITEVAADKALKSRKPKALEPGTYTVILEPAGGAVPVAADVRVERARRRRRPQLHERQGARIDEGRSEDFRRQHHDPERHRRSGPASDADRPRWPRRQTDHLDRKGRRQEPVLRSVLGQEAEQAVHGERRAAEPRDGRRRCDDRADGEVHTPRAARQLLLVHPSGRSDDAAQHRHDARRAVSDRERRDRRAGAELPLERRPRARLQQRHHARTPGADAHRRGLRQPGHRARAGDEDRGLPHDLDLAGGVAMTPNDFRRIALGLQGAVEGEHMAHPDFRANGRIFATIAPDAKQGMIKL